MTAKLKSRQKGGMALLSSGSDPEVRIFSSTKYQIMQLLKREERADLEDLSKKLSISQMAVYKHIKELESQGLVEHESRKNGVGRPRMVFRPSALSRGVYANGYVKIAGSALDYVQDRLGKEGVDGFLRQLHEKKLEEYSARVSGATLYEKAKSLVSALDDDGYMAEVKKLPGGEVELVEHHCPASAFSSKYPGMCAGERLMIEKLLGSKVEATDVNVSGFGGCRFKVIPK